MDDLGSGFNDHAVSGPGLRVPDTLRYENLHGTSLYPVLIENGLHLHILLTYDNEALVASPNIAGLEDLLEAEPLTLRLRRK